LGLLHALPKPFSPKPRDG
jgi:hypothetical protein